MADLTERVRTRLFPALLTAFGVTFLAVGLLSYGSPVEAGPLESPAPSIIAGGPSATPLAHPAAAGDPAAADRRVPTFPADRVATRVRVAALKIDLPVVAPPPPPNDYPLCDVAMYIGPARPARRGRRDVPVRPCPRGHVPADPDRVTRRRTARRCWGWSSRSTRATTSCSCTRSPRSAATSSTSRTRSAATTEQVWLQTSEGPKGTPGKTQVIAEFLSEEDADPRRRRTRGRSRWSAADASDPVDPCAGTRARPRPPAPRRR